MSRSIKKLICLAVIVVVFVLFPSFSYNENKADLSTITSVKADPGQVAVDIDYIVDPAGAYYSSGTLVSNNILWGQTVGSVDDFGYNATIPAGTTLKAQFSRNTYTWYSSAGVLDGYDTLSDGDHSAQVDAIDLSALGWAEPYFYYKIVLETTDSTITPVLSDANLYWTEGTSNTVYVASGTLASNNILDGQTVAAVTSFVYNLSAKPTGTGATIQFSQDNSAWYNSSGVQDGTDTLTTGVDNTIDLLGLGWSGANFYYKISFTSDGTGTPVFDDATVNYLETIDDVYWVGGTGNWSDAENHWALTSGGSPTTLALPVSETNVHFDANSGGGNCTLDAAMDIASLTATSGYTGTIDLADSSYSHAVSGDVTLDCTGFDMGNSTLTVGGNFANTSDTFTAGTGTVTLNGTSQTISGNTTFYNLTKSASSADSLTFAAGTTQTITNALTLSGAESNLLSLRSTSAGTQWNIAVPATNSLSYIDVKDSNNTGTVIDAANTSLFADSGNNTNWDFGAPTTSISAVTENTGASYTFGTDSTVPLTITLSCNDGYGSGCSYTYYCMDFDNTCNPASSATQRILYTQPFSPAIDQTYYVRYYSVDNLGNAESASSAIVYSNLSDSGSATYGIRQIQTSAQDTANTEDTNIIQQIADTITDTIQQATQTVIQTIFPQTPTQQQTQISYPPIEQSVPEETPIAMLEGWGLMEIRPFSEIGITQFKSDVLTLTQKIPSLNDALNNLAIDITKPGDAQKLVGIDLYMQGLTKTVLSSAEISQINSISNNKSISVGGLSTNNFASTQAVPVAQMSAVALRKIPTDIVYARTAGELIDIKSKLSFDAQGETQQEITVVSGKELELVIKPDAPAKSVLGFITLEKSSALEESPKKVSLISRIFGAGLLGFVNNVAIEDNSGNNSNSALLVQKFEYEQIKNGVYVASILAPKEEGEYKILTVVQYQDDNLQPKETQLTAVVDPEGYVYRQTNEGRLRIEGAKVSVYYYNSDSGKYELWPAEEFMQKNPVVTNDSGKYSFLLPEGSYYLQAEALGYKTYKGELFTVKENNNVVEKIELKRDTWIPLWLNWQLGNLLMLLVVIIMLGILIFLYIKKGRNMKQQV